MYHIFFIQDLYSENYKTLMKEIKDDKQLERYTMFLDWKNQYCANDYTTQSNLQIQCNPYQNPFKLLCGYWQTDSKVYIESQKIQNSQHNIEEEQRWRTDITWLQDVL